MKVSVCEDDLHAYADGLLSARQRLEMDAWLAAHPDDAARVQSWTAQNQALHAAFDAVLNDPLPLPLVQAARGHRRRRPVVRALAASLVLLATGLVGYGTGRHVALPAAPVPHLVRDAAVAHAVFSPEVRHAVEVDGAHAEHLVSWLSKRLGTPLRVPDFSPYGFQLLGGRLLAAASGPVAQFMYQDGSGRRVTLYVRRVGTDDGSVAFRRATEHGVEVFYWIDADFGYALSGAIAAMEMRHLADAAYRQLARTASPN